MKPINENAANNLFIKEKPVKTLVHLKRSREPMYTSKLNQKVDTTYAHATKLVKKLEEENLLERQRKGRKKIIRLTEKGETLARNFENLLDAENDFETSDSANRSSGTEPENKGSGLGNKLKTITH